MNILLLDIDGVLVEVRGYRAAVRGRPAGCECGD